MASPEIIKPNAERSVEAQNAASERSAELQKSRERSGEKKENTGERLESARKETEAAFSREAGKEQRGGGEPSGPTLTHATKKQRAASYENTMAQIRQEMSGPSRAFSKIIHTPTIEKASEVIGSTVARPNAVLAGSIAATFLTLAVFIIAKQYGYKLSGFETIGTFAIGWALGLIYDYARLLVRGRR